MPARHRRRIRPRGGGGHRAAPSPSDPSERCEKLGYLGKRGRSCREPSGPAAAFALEPAEPVVRYEHAAPGDLIHIDTKKLGRIVRTGHRITGNRRDSVDGAGWEFLCVAVDDHARIAFTQTKPDERRDSAIAFLRAVVTYFVGLGVTVRRNLTDSGSAFRSKRFARACQRLGLKHAFTRPYRTADQRQGRAVHPIGPARMGLRHRLRPILGTYCHDSPLDSSLQLVSPAPGHRRFRADQSAQSSE